MTHTEDTARIYKVHNIVPKLNEEDKERLKQEALMKMHEIYSKQNQRKNA